MSEYILKEDLIYWIDKWFVQKRSKQLISRELIEDEITTTEYVEWGLAGSIFEILD